MILYMAGGVSGNLAPFWRVLAREKISKTEAMKIFLAGQNGQHRINDTLFLAGAESRHWVNDVAVPCGRNALARGGQYDTVIESFRPFILESFFYVDEDMERLLPHFGDFLLDSGAFTFMSGTVGSIDWNGYIKRYADFIVRNDIKKFFELDIDSVVGYSKVKEFRRDLEKLTSRPCIPVWHVSRGMDEFKRMCEEYSYVAIGGIVSKEIKPDKYNLLPVLIKEAHKRKAKIHGLGFTALNWLPICHFDSVDSTAWTTGNRFGYLYYFDGKTMKKKDAPKGHKLGDSRAAALNNYVEWLKFQKYALTHF